MTSLQWFAAVHVGLVVAIYCCILINGFVGFQFAEDGTALSLWFLRISCLVLFAVGFFIAIATFKGFAGFSFAKPVALWIVFLLWPLVCMPIYIVSQLILVFRTLEDRWPIGDILFGTAFWVVGIVLLFAFSTTICNAIVHYIDGLFFAELCILLAVMMVYKYWDSITVSSPLFPSERPADRSASARISNSPSALNKLCGKSKIHYSQVPNLKMTRATTKVAVTVAIARLHHLVVVTTAKLHH